MSFEFSLCLCGREERECVWYGSGFWGEGLGLGLLMVWN